MIVQDEPSVERTEARPSERRLITVLFADLVGSTQLMETLGSEDFAEILADYHATCTDVVRHYGGVIAQYQGDGVICYFGYPVASEDDAVNAVSAALELLRKLQAHHPESPLRVSTRIGISTGPVILQVDGADMVGSAVGACINRAARLEALASANTVLICADTRKLVGNIFDIIDLEPQALKGFHRRQNIHQVAGRKFGVTYRYEALRGRRNSQLVARDVEMSILLKRLQQAKNGEGQRLLISATAGLGKSKLLNAFFQHNEVADCRTFMLQCSREHQATAMYPLSSYLKWVAGVSASDEIDTVHSKLQRFFTTSWQANEHQVDLLLSLLSPLGSGASPDGNDSVPLRREMMFDVLSKMIVKLTGSRGALVLAVEDIHWIDPSSAEFLLYLFDQAQLKKMLLVMTSRPEHSLDFPESDVLKIEPLSYEHSKNLARISGADAGLSAKVIELILKKSEGVPLFIEEYIDMAVDAKANGVDLLSDALPLTIDSLIQAKLDQLDDNARRSIQIASVIGRTFDSVDVQKIAQLSNEEQPKVSRRLIDKRLIFVTPTGAGHSDYSFSHASIRDAVYASMSRALKTNLHDRIARHLMAMQSTRPVGEEILGYHLHLAKQYQNAARSFMCAADVAASLGNVSEAYALLNKGLKSVAEIVHEDQRAPLEMQLLTKLASTQIVMRGPGNHDLGSSLKRIRILQENTVARGNEVALLHHTALYQWATAHMVEAEITASQLMDISKRQDDDAAYLAAHTLEGLIAWHLGRNDIAKARLTATVGRYNPELHRDLYDMVSMEFGVFSLFYLSLSETILGDADAAILNVEKAIKTAQLVKRPHAIGFSYLAAFVSAMLRGDVGIAEQFGTESLNYSTDQQFPEFVGLSNFCLGWVACQKGDSENGLERMSQGLDIWDATGFCAWQPILAALQARCLVAAGKHRTAEKLLVKYDERVRQTGENQALSPLYLARAEMLRARGENEQAKRYASNATKIATEQAGRLWLEQIAQSFPP